jgi:hypothetical protein
MRYVNSEGLNKDLAVLLSKLGWLTSSQQQGIIRLSMPNCGKDRDEKSAS